jgi:hypothetical protein
MTAPTSYVVKSGYTPCACRDCFETAVSSDMNVPELCCECEDAGCEAHAETECRSPYAYGCDPDTTDDTEENAAG